MTARVAAVITVALVAFDRAMLLGEAVWGRDISFWVVPSRWLLRGALARGELPRWDHAQGLGAPVLANPLHGLFYPLTLISLLDPIAWWTTAYLWLHTLLGALGVAALAARLGCSPAARVLAALAWALAGPNLSAWTSGLLLPAQAWMPWITLGVWSLAARPSARRAAIAALPVALSLLLGEGFMTLTALGFATLTLPAAPGIDAVTRRRAAALAGWIALAVALGAALASVSLAPALAAVSGTERAGPIDMVQALHWSVHPARLLDLIVPGGFRRASALTQHPFALARCDVDPLYFSHYLGATTLGLALIGLRRDRRSFTLAAVVALALLCAMGRHTPVYAAVRALVPPLRLMRSPEKFVNAVTPAVALLAALGLDRLAREPDRARRALALLAALGATLLALPALAPAPVAAAIARGARGAALPLAAAALAALALRRRPALGAWAMALAVFADLALNGAWLHPWHDARMVRWRPPLADAMRARFDAARAPSLPRLLRARTISRHAEDARVSPGDWRYYATLPPNLSATHGVGVMPPYDVAVSPALESLLAVRRVDVARLLSVDATVQPARASRPAGLARVAQVGTGVELLAIEESLPRVYPVARAAAMGSGEAHRRVLEDDVVAGREAVIEGPTLDAPARRSGRCALTLARNGALDARCELDAASAVVFVEQHAPGWRALVDGREAPLYRANLLVMAVRAPAGAHTISLRYSPPGLRGGLLGSALGLLGLALALRSRGTPSGSPDRSAAAC
ncbi:MAG: YfhO family protein [Polyangiales bacterium]